jgi:hypothetical protein
LATIETIKEEQDEDEDCQQDTHKHHIKFRERNHPPLISQREAGGSAREVYIDSARMSFRTEIVPAAGSVTERKPSTGKGRWKR